MQSDIDRIEVWAQIFNDPTKLITTLLTNIIKNFASITGDVTKASTDIAAADYYDTGVDVSDIMIQALGPVPEGPETLKVTQW